MLLTTSALDTTTSRCSPVAATNRQEARARKKFQFFCSRRTAPSYRAANLILLQLLEAHLQALSGSTFRSKAGPNALVSARSATKMGISTWQAVQQRGRLRERNYPRVPYYHGLLNHYELYDVFLDGTTSGFEVLNRVHRVTNTDMSRAFTVDASVCIPRMIPWRDWEEWYRVKVS